MTADLSTWDQAQAYITHNGIYFKNLLKKGRFGGAYSNLIKLAANLFNGYLDVEEKPPFSPLELYRLDDSNWNVAMSAFIIRRYNWHIAAFMTNDEIVEKVEDILSEE